MLSVRQVAERYGVSVRTVQRWVFEQRIPHHKITQRTLRFNEVELDMWDQRNAVPVGKFHRERGA